MAATDPQMKLRLPHGLKDRVQTAAEANSRSMNAEIVARLEQSFLATPGDQAVEDQVAENEKRIQILENAFLDLAELLSAPKGDQAELFDRPEYRVDPLAASAVREGKRYLEIRQNLKDRPDETDREAEEVARRKRDPNE